MQGGLESQLVRSLVFPCAMRVITVAGVKFVGVPQPKPMHGFLPNFQDMLTPVGSRADQVFGGI